MFIIFVTRLTLAFLFLGGLVQAAVPPVLYTIFPFGSNTLSPAHHTANFWEYQDDASNYARRAGSGQRCVYTIETEDIENSFSKRNSNDGKGEWEATFDVSKFKLHIRSQECFRFDDTSVVYSFGSRRWRNQ